MQGLNLANIPEIDEKDNSLIIAITGGIASGKSEVAKIISEMGFVVISTDYLAKKVMSDDMDVINQIIASFGVDSFIENKINSKYLSDIVFNSSEKLNQLNSIVHPPVIEMMIREIEFQISKGFNLVFVESALIYEAGLDEGFDYIVCVTSSDDNRVKRAISRSGLSKEDILKRMKEQISQDEKVKLADFTIQNDGTLDDLKKSVEFLMPILTSLPPRNNYSFIEADSE